MVLSRGFVTVALVVYTVLSKFAKSVTAKSLHDNSPKCDCYVTNGRSSAFFQYHRYFDFGDVSTDSVYDSEPANVTDSQSSGDEPSQQGYIRSHAFSKDWSIQTWGRKSTPPVYPVTMQMSPQNVFIQRNPEELPSTHLTLRAYRSRNFYSTAEIQYQQRNLLHASIRLRARIRGASGSVAGIFVYLNDTQESDIEILTNDPSNHIRLTNHPVFDNDGVYVPNAMSDVELPGPTVWTDWVTYRLDWTPTKSSWYANGQWLFEKEFGVPRFPSVLIINMWGNGGTWAGNMTLGSAAYLDIRWIDVVFNTSGPVAGYTPDETKRKFRRDTGLLEKREDDDNCHRVCAVDDIPAVGFPVLVSDATRTTWYSQRTLEYILAITLAVVVII
ncbi:hypothetical protein RBB50_004963 [Rhinocladiella similis]